MCSSDLEREKQGLETLDVDENLMELARIRAEELEEKFSHERPDGTHAAQAFSGGENIAGDYTSPSAVMEAWMGSEGHRANILRERFHYIGVGCYQDTNGDLYWVQLFSPRKTSYDLRLAKEPERALFFAASQNEAAIFMKGQVFK